MPDRSGLIRRWQNNEASALKAREKNARAAAGYLERSIDVVEGLLMLDRHSKSACWSWELERRMLAAMRAQLLGQPVRAYGYLVMEDGIDDLLGASQPTSADELSKLGLAPHPKRKSRKSKSRKRR